MPAKRIDDLDFPFVLHVDAAVAPSHTAGRWHEGTTEFKMNEDAAKIPLGPCANVEHATLDDSTVPPLVHTRTVKQHNRIRRRRGIGWAGGDDGGFFPFDTAEPFLRGQETETFGAISSLMRVLLPMRVFRETYSIRLLPY